MAKLLVLHGPNLNLLGTREPEVYGRTTLADIDAALAARAAQAGHVLESFQSNAEHALVERVQAARGDGTAARPGRMRLGRRFEWLGVYGRGVAHLKGFRSGLVKDAGAVLEPVMSAS